MSAFALGANALHGAAVAFGRSHAVAVKSRVVGSSHRAIRRVAISPVRCAATETAEKLEIKLPPVDGRVRVRFAPSPTGNLHVGGARTALFNWLYARNLGGTFVLRVEDTDTARSTSESEDAMVGPEWIAWTGTRGRTAAGRTAVPQSSARPSTSSSRTSSWRRARVPVLLHGQGATMMEEEQGRRSSRPRRQVGHRVGVDAELAKGTPHTYRFRVPEGERVEIDDMIRGKVGWDTDTLGDSLLLRSGLPVYNFCVAVDDATMGITHVLRAEEHLPNTLRQALVYDALKFPRPTFGHMSLILAPDRSKLSKRHGATSVGQFKDQGYLKQTMINYLSQLGWNDGTEQEIYETEELVKLFSTDRINKSPAVFDTAKLNWMNGQHIRLMPAEKQVEMIGAALVENGLAEDVNSAFTGKAVALCANGIELVQDATAEVRQILEYPLAENVADAKMVKIFEDDFGEIVDAIVAGHESGELVKAIEAGEFKKFVNATGKSLERKGKRLFMPFRVALTGRMQGPEVGDVLDLLVAEGAPASAVSLDARIEQLKAQSAAWAK